MSIDYQERQSSYIGVKRPYIHCVQSQTPSILSLKAFDTLYIQRTEHDGLRPKHNRKSNNLREAE